MLSPEKLRTELTLIKSHTGNRFNINSFCHHQTQANIEREQRLLKILEPYFEEFDLNTTDITIGAGRELFCEIIADIFTNFSFASAIGNRLLSEIGSINLDTPEFTLASA